MPHLEDILALKPACVWLQSGITNHEFEQKLAAAGIRVVPSRCLKVDRAAACGRSHL
ncbi:DNA-binding [Micractinium conductrix]|uniref:DNA-binding n=1 Tax=Micractinium conductrix TaxID=554055 RepID=A0A2P6VHB6_9CHLO|nr:DNA-binding [Micractinium conductrix]|eukprot:PSC73479.1 DNA-binding [Micractinium conductrix]